MRAMKRFLYILAVLFVSLLLVGAMAVCVLQSERVEHAVLRLATDELSRGIGAKAHIGNMQYRFPARLRIDSIYLSDQQGDTLAYIDELYVHLRPMPLFKQQIVFSRVDIRGGVANIYHLDSARLNCSFLGDLFHSDTTRTFSAFLSVRDVRIDNVRARFDDYHARLDHASLDLYHFTADSLDAAVNHLQGTAWNGDSAPLVVNDLQVRFLYNDTLVALPSLYLRLPESELSTHGHIVFRRDSAANQTALLLDIPQAELCPRDIALFSPALLRLDKKLRLETSLQGTADSLAITDLTLTYDRHPLFRGNAQVVGKLQENPYVRLQCEDLTANAAIVQDFVSDWQGKPFRLPKEVQRLGNIHYRGQIEGRLHNLALHGAFRTALGVITTEATVVSDSAFRDLQYSARIATNKFRLGKMLAQPSLGALSMDFRSSGTIRNGIPMGTVRGRVRDVSYNGYTYQAIRIDGKFKPQHFDGTLSINDENLQLRFAGLVNLTEQAPDINFDLRLERFRPEVLGVSDRLRNTETGFTLAANLSGINPDLMNGYLVIDSLRLRNGQDSVLMQQLKLTVQAGEQDRKQIKLTSDFATAGVVGSFRYAELPDAFLRLAYRYLPDAFMQPAGQRIAAMSGFLPQSVDFYLYGHKLRALQKVLHLPFTIGDQPVLKGFYHEQDSTFGVQAYAGKIATKKAPIQDITLSFNNFDGPALLSVAAKALNMSALTHVSVSENTLNMDLALQQVDSAEHVYAGNVHLHTHFEQYAGAPLIDLHMLPSSVVLKDSLYNIGESHIRYCVADTTLHVQDFLIEAAHQYIRANGTGSRGDDSLRVELGNVDAGFILPFVLPEEKFKLSGRASGWATLYNLFSQPVFEADVRLDSACINDTYLGTAIATVALDKETKNILIDGDVYTPSEHKMAHVDGNVITADKHWELQIYPDSVPLGFINHWTNGILSDISGYGSGEVQIFGESDTHKTWVTAQVKAIDGALTIPFTGCRYYLTDSVIMDSASIRFRDITLYDEERHPLYLDGALYHDNFLDFRYNFSVRVDDALALNLPDKAGEMLQGRVYARGDVRIDGNEDEVRIEADARTVGKSRFRFSIDYASTASESNFITFVDHNQVSIITPEEDEDLPVYTAEERRKSDTRILLAMNIDVDQHLLAQLMLGERNGDMIQGRGDGALRFTYDSHKNDIKLMGNYVLQQGTLDFTVGNIIRRQFTISEGSSVSFTGAPEQPQLNVTAKYRVTASLKDLFGSEISQLATTRTSVPVNTCLSLRGTLDAPVLQFAIELPNSDEAIQSQVKAIINTDEMLMRQVVYLLVFGKFFMPEYMTSTQYIGVNESYSLLSSTITGQINAWLSKLTNVFTMGVNIRTDGEGADASQEYEAQFQLQPIDRLVINGNVGYRYNDIANQPFFGDLDVEVLLTEDGKLRLKGYTHTVDKYSLRQASTIQGIGFVWKYDFNTPTPEEREERKLLREQKKQQRQHPAAGQTDTVANTQ